MKKILILTVNQKVKGSIGVYQNKYLHSNEAKIFERNYDDLIISFDRKNTKILLGNKDICNYNYIYITDSHKNRELTTALAILFNLLRLNFSDPALAETYFGGKMVQLSRISEHNIATPKSLFVSTKRLKENTPLKEIKRIGFPLVIKNTAANSGIDNHLVKDLADLNRVIELLDSNSNYILQEYIPNDFDYRIFVLRNTIGTIQLRVRTNPNDHRNNIALGAVPQYEKISEASSDLKKMAIRAAQIMKRDLAGVDIIKNKITGKYYLLEINPVPGIAYESPSEIALAKYLLKRVSK